ncbi:hypothetical protein HY450_02135 [Candidatus Pacearchaeota archaeon]|nr:hypothetical protein [Candidatus Pacearchaeota archaeon]
MSLENARYCLSVMKKIGSYRGQRIGRINSDFRGLSVGYNPGDIVLFVEKGRNAVVERPLSRVEVDSIVKNGGQVTENHISGIPRRFIEEIL